MNNVLSAYQKLEEINRLQAEIIDDLFLQLCQYAEMAELEDILSKIKIAAKENEKRGTI